MEIIQAQVHRNIQSKTNKQARYSSATRSKNSYGYSSRKVSTWEYSEGHKQIRKICISNDSREFHQMEVGQVKVHGNIQIGTNKQGRYALTTRSKWGQVQTYSIKTRISELGQIETGKMQPWQGCDRDDSDDGIDNPPTCISRSQFGFFWRGRRMRGAPLTRYPANKLHQVYTPNIVQQVPSKYTAPVTVQIAPGTLLIYYNRYPPNILYQVPSKLHKVPPQFSSAKCIWVRDNYSEIVANFTNTKRTVKMQIQNGNTNTPHTM